MKKKILIILTLLMLISAVGCKAKLDGPQQTVKEYHSRFYDCLIDLKDTDMSDILYTESIQAYNKVTMLKTMITREKCSIEQGYGHEEKKVNLVYTFKDTVYNADGSATVTVDIDRTGQVSGDTVIADPYFVYYGENVFTLIQHDGKWKISSHTADTMGGFPIVEYPDDKKVEFDEQQVIEEYYSNSK